MAVAAPAAASAANKEFVKQAHGFSLVQQQFVREYDSHVLMYKHEKTGAAAAHIVWQLAGCVAVQGGTRGQCIGEHVGSACGNAAGGRDGMCT
jgi:hypothetical protein